MSKSLNLIKYLLYAGIFAVPFLAFIVSSSMFFPFITGKNFSFRIIVEVMTALWLILMLFDTGYKPKKSWVLAMLAIFVGIVALSSIFGENFYRSFWSNYERMEGLVTYLHLLAYFFVLVRRDENGKSLELAFPHLVVCQRYYRFLRRFPVVGSVPDSSRQQA